MYSPNVSERSRHYRRWQDRKRRRTARAQVKRSARPWVVTVSFVAVFLADRFLGTGDVVVGLALSVILALQIDLVLELREKKEIADGVSRLIMSIEKRPELTRDLTAMAESYTTLIQARDRQPEFIEEARTSLLHVVGKLEELERGRLRTPRFDNQLMLAMYDRVERSVMATTESSDCDWWSSETGRRYLELNAAAVRRGVVITRIFLLSDDVDDPALQEVLHANQEVGVRIATVVRRGLPAELQQNLTIFDDVLTHIDVVNGVGETIEYIYTQHEADVRRSLSTFRQLQARALR